MVGQPLHVLGQSGQGSDYPPERTEPQERTGKNPEQRRGEHGDQDGAADRGLYHLGSGKQPAGRIELPRRLLQQRPSGSRRLGRIGVPHGAACLLQVRGGPHRIRRVGEPIDRSDRRQGDGGDGGEGQGDQGKRIASHASSGISTDVLGTTPDHNAPGVSPA